MRKERKNNMKKTGIIMVSNHNEIGGATKSMLSLANKLNETSKICVITPHKKMYMNIVKRIIYLL